MPVGEADALPEPALELWRKVLPLGLLFAAASFNLTVLQSCKDAILITAAGAETLPFLASFGVLPLSVLFFMFLGALSARVRPSRVFPLAVAPLLAFYALFAAVLYPLAPALHPIPLMEAAMAAVPVPGLHGLFKMAGYWLYSLFFCCAELWGPVVISVLFWGLANDACTVDEAKSTYPLLAIGANVALVAAGAFIRGVNAWLPTAGANALAGRLGCLDAATGLADRQLLSLRVLVGAVLLTSGVMLAAKAYVDASIVQPRRRAEAKAAKAAAKAAAAAAAAAGADAADALAAAPHADKQAEQQPQVKKDKKKKGSFSESMAVLRACPKVRNLAALVIGYGLSHRLFEFCWKSTLRALYPTVEAYQGALADVATATGVTTLAFMFASRVVFRRFGWGVAAAVTPAVMGVAGVVFFAASASLAAAGAPAPAGAVTAAAVAGAVTQVFARSSKYSLFDPSKEMVYIVMDPRERARGKAAIDLLAAQAGKAGASWLTSLLMLAFGSISAAVPVVGAIYVGVIGLWLAATRQLSAQMGATETGAGEAAAAAQGQQQQQQQGQQQQGQQQQQRALQGGGGGEGGGGGSGGAKERAPPAAASAPPAPRPPAPPPPPPASPAPPGDAAASAALSSAAAANGAHALGGSNGNGNGNGGGRTPPPQQQQPQQLPQQPQQPLADAPAAAATSA